MVDDAAIGQQLRPVANIPVNKAVPCFRRNTLQIAKVPSVGQLIEINDWTTLRRQPLQNEIGADESGAAGHNNRIYLHVSAQLKRLNVLGT